MSKQEVVAVVGSLRAGSVNGATARAAVAATPETVALTVHDVSEVPLFNGDFEETELPRSVLELHDAVGRADGLLLFSPEYNGSFPAVTKNVIDWLSRPPRSWEGVAISLVATTPGPRAGKGVRDHFSAIMGHQPVRLYETLGIGGYRDKLDDRGEISDGETLNELSRYLGDFARFCADSDSD